MWLLDGLGKYEYHSRTWETQNEEAKKDEFIHSLVVKGEYKPHLLSRSILREKKSLATVLQESI